MNPCAFSFDGKSIICAPRDGTLRLWDTASGREMARWTHDVTLLCCALSQHGYLALAADRQGGIRFLDVVGVAEAAYTFVFNTPLSWQAEREASDLKRTNKSEQHPRPLALLRWLLVRK